MFHDYLKQQSKGISNFACLSQKHAKNKVFDINNLPKK